MTWWFWALLVVVLVVGYLSQVAGRLDRLHIRVDRARAALDEQLLRRAAVATDLATSGLLDPASSLVIGEAAHRARTSDAESIEQTQGELTVVLRAAFEDAEDVEALRADPSASELISDLGAACQRVALARQFLDDAVRSCVRVRSQRLVRALRLAGRAPWPRTLEFADEPPAALQTA